jgi:hypothetical protein
MSEAANAPYATDGSDFRGALRHHYAVALKRYAIHLVIWVPVTLTILVWEEMGALGLFVGPICLFLTGVAFYSRISATRRCSRVFHVYPLEFRGPAEVVHEEDESITLRFNDDGADDSVSMQVEIAEIFGVLPEGTMSGIWFAGDDAFGGAGLVPGTGQLLFMQPRDWDTRAELRQSASTDRVDKAWRAHIQQRIDIK